MGTWGVERKTATLLSGIWLPRWHSGKESTSQAEGADLIPWSRRSPGGGNGNPLQYSGLGNHMGRGTQQATFHRVTQSWTQLKQLSTRMTPEAIVTSKSTLSLYRTR